MARKTSTRVLEARLNGRLVGELKVAETGAIAFQYSPEWLAWEYATAISRSLPLGRVPHRGAKVLAVIDNLLPDNADIRQTVATRVGAAGSDAFSLIEKIGIDCVGALQFVAPGRPPGKIGAITGHRISNATIGKLLRDLARAPLGLSDDDDSFRLSLAGAQEKTALTFYNKNWLKPSGSTATTHILKPTLKLMNGLNFSHSVENEHLCLRICEIFGLETARTSIEDFGGVSTLCVERFDRVWTPDGRLLRLPQEDMCQALGVPSIQKYESKGGPGIPEIMTLLKESDTAEKDREAFMRAQIVFWLLGATDGHAKNFSIRLSLGGGFAMTPLYDVLSLEPLFADGILPRTRMQLAMSLGRGRRQLDTVEPTDFSQTAKACNFSQRTLAATVEDVLTRSAAALALIDKDEPGALPRKSRHAIQKGMKTRLIALKKAASDLPLKT